MKTMRQGGFDEPYCSDNCYNKAGAEIGMNVVRSLNGTCGFCQSDVRVTVGSAVKLIPYRNQFLFICPACQYKARDFVSGIRECCICGKSLASQ